MRSESHYWIIVVEVELFGAQAWIKGTLGSSETTGVTLVTLKTDIVDRLDSEEGGPVEVFILWKANSTPTIETPVVNVCMAQNYIKNRLCPKKKTICVSVRRKRTYMLENRKICKNISFHCDIYPLILGPSNPSLSFLLRFFFPFNPEPNYSLGAADNQPHWLIQRQSDIKRLIGWDNTDIKSHLFVVFSLVPYGMC